jgi:hypothetical protein
MAINSHNKPDFAQALSISFFENALWKAGQIPEERKELAFADRNILSS